MKEYTLKGWRARAVLYAAMLQLITTGAIVAFYAAMAAVYFAAFRPTLEQQF